jgi:hypothetical protein
VPAHVRERLLGDPVHGQPRLRPELALAPLDGDPARDRGVALELGHEVVEPLRAGQVVAPEHADRPPRLLEARLCQVVRALDGAAELGIEPLAVARRQQPRPLELEHQPRQGVGEDVVHLPGEVLALRERRRPRLRRP